MRASSAPLSGSETIDKIELAVLSSFRDSRINTSVLLKENILSLSINYIGTVRSAPSAAEE